MKPGRWDKRFWASTRGRLISLLRQSSRSVNELADALDITANGVRMHLDRLERDGLVRPSGTRAGTRKPLTTYELAPEAKQQLFPRMYGLILRQLLDVLTERLTAKQVKEIVQLVGHRLAASQRSAVQADNLSERIVQAVALLGDWGGFCQSERQDGKFILRCSDCPMGQVVAGHPEVCQLVETMLAEVLETPVKYRCQSEPSPQCYFEIKAAGAPSR